MNKWINQMNDWIGIDGTIVHQDSLCLSSYQTGTAKGRRKKKLLSAVGRGGGQCPP